MRALLWTAACLLLASGGMALAARRLGAMRNTMPGIMNARPVVHRRVAASLPPLVGYVQPPVPASTLPVPRPPYTDTEPHPIAVTAVGAGEVRSAVASAVARDHLVASRLGSFALSNVWRIDARLSVGVGAFAGPGLPGVITFPSGGPSVFYRLPENGAPGRPHIEGVRGDWVLIGQGYGYTVFNYRTHAITSSDQNGNAGATVRMYP